MCIQFGETLIKYIRMMDKQYKETAEYLAKRVTGNPETAIILGSGLGSLAEQIEDATIIPYNEIDTIEPQYIAPGAKVERCIIGEAAEIHGAVINSVIGPNVYIGPGAVVRDSIIMKDTRWNR